MKVLVTGAAGFIGSATAEQLAARGDEVVGIDNLNDYYDVRLKEARLRRVATSAGECFRFVRMDIADRESIARLFREERFDRVVHLGAQAGVRHSLDDPHAYAQSNLVGTLNILEGCRASDVEHLVFASTSSVYGANSSLPYSVHQPAVHPLSFYAATKRAGELMAHSYASLYGLACTGLRFFTVYGPWGRPDMALFRFAENILAGRPIDVFNFGRHRRDFTYIDDIVLGVIGSLDHVAAGDDSWDPNSPDPASSRAPYRIYNIGNCQSVELGRCIEILEECLGMQAQRNFLPLQAGDMPDTLADTDGLVRDIGYRPSTPVEVGIRRFVDWYRDYFRV